MTATKIDLRERTADERERRADARERKADERDSRAAAERRIGAEENEASAVAAHGLLNAAAVVTMGIEMLETNWDAMRGTDRRRLLHRMQVHASSIDSRLRDVIQGRSGLHTS